MEGVIFRFCRGRLLQSLPPCVTLTAKGCDLMAKNDHDELYAQMRQDAPDELWDVYDAAGRKTGRVQRRGDPLAPGDCHLCVHVWIRDAAGRFLLTRRAPEKSGAGLWECTGGSALAGEDSLAAALREAKEETGIELDPRNGALLFRFSGAHYHCDVWLFRQALRLADVVAPFTPKGSSWTLRIWTGCWPCPKRESLIMRDPYIYNKVEIWYLSLQGGACT